MRRTYAHGVTPCEGTCNRMLRPSHTTITQHPGTVRREANGMCLTCHRKHGKKTVRPAAAKARTDVVEDREVRAAAESLEAYLRARRRRGVPAEGRSSMGLAA